MKEISLILTIFRLKSFDDKGFEFRLFSTENVVIFDEKLFCEKHDFTLSKEHNKPIPMKREEEVIYLN